MCKNRGGNRLPAASLGVECHSPWGSASPRLSVLRGAGSKLNRVGVVKRWRESDARHHRILIVMHDMMIEELPNDLLSHILVFLQISERLKVARCNQSLQHRLYRECPRAWKSIDVSRDDTACRHLSDAALTVLLTNVNAREITVVLHLGGCRRIRGTGLEPLCHSRMLERIYLWGTGAKEIPEPAISVLKTMIPHHLCTVMFSHEPLPEKDALICFFGKLRHARLQDAMQNKVHCTSCQLPVMEGSRQLVQNVWGIHILCFGCSKPYCRRASCETDVKECRVCSELFCADCNLAKQCFNCGRSYCMDCIHFDECLECNRSYCGPCRSAANILVKCQGCRKAVCNNSNCLASPQACRNNNCLLCNNCFVYETCSVCGSRKCKQCEFGSLCQSKRYLMRYCTRSEKCSSSDSTRECRACDT